MRAQSLSEPCLPACPCLCLPCVPRAESEAARGGAELLAASRERELALMASLAEMRDLLAAHDNELALKEDSFRCLGGGGGGPHGTEGGKGARMLPYGGRWHRHLTKGGGGEGT